SALAERLAAAGGKVVSYPVDVTDSAAVRRMVESAEQQFGGLDGLVNSAGGFPKPVKLSEMSDETWRRVVQLNLDGTFYCCREAAQAMRRAGGGAIVNLSSEAARMPAWETGCHYVAAKAGVIGLTKHLARELGRDRIRVNAVAPGVTLTPRVDALWDEGKKRQLTDLTPIGRLAATEEMVGPILFLLDPASSHVTGTVLDVNGGRVM